MTLLIGLIAAGRIFVDNAFEILGSGPSAVEMVIRRITSSHKVEVKHKNGMRRRTRDTDQLVFQKSVPKAPSFLRLPASLHFDRPISRYLYLLSLLRAPTYKHLRKLGEQRSSTLLANRRDI